MVSMVVREFCGNCILLASYVHCPVNVHRVMYTYIRMNKRPKLLSILVNILNILYFKLSLFSTEWMTGTTIDNIILCYSRREQITPNRLQRNVLITCQQNGHTEHKFLHLTDAKWSITQDYVLSYHQMVCTYYYYPFLCWTFSIILKFLCFLLFIPPNHQSSAESYWWVYLFYPINTIPPGYYNWRGTCLTLIPILWHVWKIRSVSRWFTQGQSCSIRQTWTDAYVK